VSRVSRDAAGTSPARRLKRHADFE